MIEQLLVSVGSLSCILVGAASAAEADPVAALIGGGGLAGLQVWNIIQTAGVKDRLSKITTRIAVLESRLDVKEEADGDE